MCIFGCFRELCIEQLFLLRRFHDIIRLYLSTFRFLSWVFPATVLLARPYFLVELMTYTAHFRRHVLEVLAARVLHAVSMSHKTLAVWIRAECHFVWRFAQVQSIQAS